MRQQPAFLVKISRKLRREMSLPEVLLWNQLRPKVNTECTIRRQVSVLDKYVLDFYCPKLKIAFEIDGIAFHDGQEIKDEQRQKAIEATGIRFVRISAARVLKNPFGVASLVIQICTGEIQFEDLD
jgi:very-short-patch-repair endonuclease